VKPPRHQLGATVAMPSGQTGVVVGVFLDGARAIQYVRCWSCDRQEDADGVTEELPLESGYCYLLSLPGRRIGFVREDDARPHAAMPEALERRAPSVLYQPEARRIRQPGAPKQARQTPVPPRVPEDMVWVGRISPRQLEVLQAVKRCESPPTTRELCVALGVRSTFSAHSLVADLAKRKLLRRGGDGGAGIRLTHHGERILACQDVDRSQPPPDASSSRSISPSG